MITTSSNRSTPVRISDGENPFYLLCNGAPLPMAVKSGVQEALDWRDEWEASASREDKFESLFHPTLRVWVGGAEDGASAVLEAQTAWL